MSTIGAEMGQLEALKNTFDREAQNVGELTSTISGQLGNTWWQGPAADRFRGSWESDYQPMLQRLQQSLQEASGEVARRHQALTEAGS